MGAKLWLTLDRADVVARELTRVFPREIRNFRSTVERAAEGDWPAAREYVVAWQGLAEGLLKRIREERPEAVSQDPGGRLLLVDAKGDPVEVTRERLLAAAPTAPFSPWVGQLGLGRGIGVHLVAELRECVPGAAPLVPPTGLCIHWAPDAAMLTALRLIEQAVAEETRGEAPGLGSAALLHQVMGAFDLDRTGLARLFGVKRQAVEQWERRGVPSERQAKLAVIVAIGELLDRQLRSGVVPGVARRGAPAYRGRSMLEMIARDHHEAVLEGIRRSFDWATTA